MKHYTKGTPHAPAKHETYWREQARTLLASGLIPPAAATYRRRASRTNAELCARLWHYIEHNAPCPSCGAIGQLMEGLIDPIYCNNCLHIALGGPA
jgi:hypothetical protein